MPSPCPICEDRKFRKTFDQLVVAGGDLAAAKKLCENEMTLPYGVPPSSLRLKVHATEHTKIEPEKIHPSFMKTVRRDPAEVEAERVEKGARKAVVETYLDQVVAINIDEVLASIGIAQKPGNLSEVLNVAQQLSLAMNMIAGAIVVDRLRKHAADPQGVAFPSVPIKAAEITSQMMAASFGFSQSVSLQAAADVLERAGYEVIERGRLDSHTLPSGSEE